MKSKLLVLLFICMALLTSCDLISQRMNKQTIISTNINGGEKRPDQLELDVKEAGNYIINGINIRIISENELEFFDKFTLSLAKNELFARKGYRFKDPDLHAYFSNKEWYSPLTEGIVKFDDFSEIEKQNFDMIDKWYTDFSLNGYTQSEYTQSIKVDIDNDGNEESINTRFINEAGEFRCVITVVSGAKEFSYEEKGNLINKLFLADFNDEDDFIEFYIYDNGPSGDPTTLIFRFANNEISKVAQLTGFITAYDGKGSIFTEFSRTGEKYNQTLSYYELEKGVVFTEKKDIEGKLLQYDHRVILFDGSKPIGASLQSPLSKSTSKSDVEEIIRAYDQKQIVKVCEPNELLKILDVDNTYWGLFEEGSVRNIRIMVETADGKRGWLEWMNGGD